MTTYTAHREAAVALLTEADLARPEARPVMLARAQVHATLALAAATAEQGCGACDEFHIAAVVPPRVHDVEDLIQGPSSRAERV